MTPPINMDRTWFVLGYVQAVGWLAYVALLIWFRLPLPILLPCLGIAGYALGTIIYTLAQEDWWQ
jgi:hypothetical protein